jgi:hypothetical protein
MEPKSNEDQRKREIDERETDEREQDSEQSKAHLPFVNEGLELVRDSHC